MLLCWVTLPLGGGECGLLIFWQILIGGRVCYRMLLKGVFRLLGGGIRGLLINRVMSVMRRRGYCSRWLARLLCAFM